MTENYIIFVEIILIMGYITTGIGFDIDLYNEMERLRDIDNISRSQYVQTAVRWQNLRIKKQNISEFIKNLDSKEMEILKNEIKKRG